ncbi:MAG: ATP-binding protein [Fibrobacterota bacterium]
MAEKPGFEELRKKAEEYLASIEKEGLTHSGALPESSTEDLKSALNELMVYQVELEIQNEELRRAQSELERTRDRYSHLFSNAPAGYVLLDESGIIFQANATFENMTGHDSVFLNNRPFQELIANEDKNIFLARYKAFFKNPKNKAMELKIKTAGGDILHSRLEGRHEHKMSRLFGREKSKDLFFLIISDISDLRKSHDALSVSETRFKNFFRNMTAGAVLYRVSSSGENFIIEDMNPAAEKILSIKKNETKNKPVEESFPAAKEFGIIKALKKAASDGNPVFIPASDYKDGRIDRFLENTVFRLSEDIIAAVFEDKTESRKMEKMIRHAAKMQAIGQLAGGIAHDFNNILSGIIGYSDMTLSFLPEEGIPRKNIERVLKAADRAKSLTDQILTFSRQNTDVKKAVSLKPVINEVLDFIKASLPATVSLNAEIADKTAPVYADTNKVHEALINLCTNAFQAAGDSGSISVSLYEKMIDRGKTTEIGILPRGKYTVVSVSDNGGGISNETINRMFEPFYTTKKDGKGTGLGLAVVYGIMEAHNGGITVKSSPPEGSKISLYFPATDCRKTEIPANRQDPENFRGTETVLICDDEEMITELLGEILKSLGYKTVECISSSEALARFTDSPGKFDVLITDQVMPGMTGLELIRRIKLKRPDIPVMLCTGYGSGVSKEMALKTGVSTFLMKPVDKLELLFELRKIIDGKTSTEKKEIEND